MQIEVGCKESDMILTTKHAHKQENIRKLILSYNPQMEYSLADNFDFSPEGILAPILDFYSSEL